MPQVPKRCTHLSVDALELAERPGKKARTLNYIQVGSLGLALAAHEGTLLSFEMVNQRVDEPELRAYASFLASDPPLVNFTLRSAQIYGDGAALLAEALLTNSHLEVLDLAQNFVGNDGAQALGDALGRAAAATGLVRQQQWQVTALH